MELRTALLHPRGRGKPQNFFSMFSKNPTEQESHNIFKKNKKQKGRGQRSRAQEEAALDPVGILEVTGKYRKFGCMKLSRETEV